MADITSCSAPGLVNSLEQHAQSHHALDDDEAFYSRIEAVTCAELGSPDATARAAALGGLSESMGYPENVTVGILQHRMHQRPGNARIRSKDK